jgi:hypothetical protein
MNPMRKAIFLFIILALIIILLLILGRKNLSSEIIINAPIGKVWKEFTGFSEYPKWNPFIKSLSGEVNIGNTIHVVIQPKGGTPMNFNPVITQLNDKDILVWEGRLFLPGIFTGRHAFQVIRIDDNKTKFIQKEDFNGLLVPFIDLNPTLEGFKSMNAILKERAER